MNNLKSYTEYAVSTPTTDFVIGFDFNYGTDAVNVTVDDVPATEAGYSIIYLNSTTMRLNPAVPTGVVRLQRETDIDVPDNQFTAGAKFIASNMDENFTQIRHAQQEVRDGFEKLSEDTYEIIDTLQVVGQAAQDAADAAEQAAQTANDAAAQVNDKVSYQDLDNAIAVTPHNNLQDRDVAGAHTASSITDESGQTQQEINDTVLGDNGSKFVNLTLSNVANTVKKSLYDVVYDQIIDVTWFGARGDWDAATQTGTDNTNAVSKAIAYFSTLGTRRQGGRRAIKFPSGNYKLSTINIPSSIIFGLCFIGDDRNTSILWFDHTDPQTAITSSVEQVEFQNLGIFGTLSESNSGDDTLWKQVGFRGEQYAKRPDIDVRFFNCSIVYFKEFAQIYGRGCTFDSCILGYIRTLLNIVCSTETVFTTAANNKLQTGMRHYVIQNSRFDVVSTILTVSGTGTQREFINGIFFNTNEFTSCDALIKTQVNSTLRRPIISGINAQSSFATGIIQAHNIVGGGISTGAINRLADDALNPSVVADTIYSVVKNTGYLSNFKIFSLDVRGIYSSIVEVGAASKDVKITGCDFQDAWTFAKSTDKKVFDSATACNGLWIKDNTFESKVTTGTFKYYNDVQIGNTKTYIKDNKSNFNFNDQRFSYTPQLLVNGVATSVAATTAHGRYYYDDTFVYADVILTVTPTETSGSLAVSLPPIAAIAENSTASVNYAGSGQVNRTLGFSASGYVFAPIVINPSNQQAELYKTKDMVTERVTVADRAGVTNLIVSFKYRYK